MPPPPLHAAVGGRCGGHHRSQDLGQAAGRTRLAGSRRFAAFHVLVPGHWCVRQGHDLCEQLEREIAIAFTRTHVLTHLKPIEDPNSWDDQNFRWEQG